MCKGHKYIRNIKVKLHPNSVYLSKDNSCSSNSNYIEKGHSYSLIRKYYVKVTVANYSNYLDKAHSCAFIRNI